MTAMRRTAIPRHGETQRSRLDDDMMRTGDQRGPWRGADDEGIRPDELEERGGESSRHIAVIPIVGARSGVRIQTCGRGQRVIPRRCIPSLGGRYAMQRSSSCPERRRELYPPAPTPVD